MCKKKNGESMKWRLQLHALLQDVHEWAMINAVSCACADCRPNLQSWPPMPYMCNHGLNVACGWIMDYACMTRSIDKQTVGCTNCARGTGKSLNKTCERHADGLCNAVTQCTTVTCVHAFVRGTVRVSNKTRLTHATDIKNESVCI